jgi:fumarate hydratase class II
VGAQVIGNDAAITIGGMQGQFELNVRIPLMARNLVGHAGSISLLANTAELLRTKCVEGIVANLDGAKRSAESTLAAATALNPFIGYDKAGEIVKEAAASGRMLRDVALEKGVDEATYEKAMDLRKMAEGSSAEQ